MSRGLWIAVALGVAGSCGAGAELEPPTLALRFEMGERALGKDLYQLAVWLETPEGEFLDTVYVTDKIGREGLGNGYMTFLGFTIREAPEALPVWAHARGIRYGKSPYPPKDQPLPDAVTGATPKARVVTRTFRPSPQVLAKLNGSRLVCVAEINVAKDGVPSLVYRGTLDPKGSGAATLAYAGTGHPKGTSGAVTRQPPRKGRPTDFITAASIGRQ